jgi:hypothetical protein
MVEESIGDFAAIPEVEAFVRAIKPELVVPLVVYLASSACQLTHHNFSAGGGRFSRVFIGLGDGWLGSSSGGATVEDVATHLEEITAPDGYTIPESIFDEVAAICDRLGITASST